ncbi:hypothetical protein ACH41E_34640 [Streptomyces sp. NPDC020412]|uniref:hypothetical protein n=1 Tax=Streptomyces sp. NPDC020412 TaxID=3365073 RepID=UPI0037A4A13B
MSTLTATATASTTADDATALWRDLVIEDLAPLGAGQFQAGTCICWVDEPQDARGTRNDAAVTVRLN